MRSTATAIDAYVPVPPASSPRFARSADSERPSARNRATSPVALQRPPRSLRHSSLLERAAELSAETRPELFRPTQTDSW